MTAPPSVRQTLERMLREHEKNVQTWQGLCRDAVGDYTDSLKRAQQEADALRTALELINKFGRVEGVPKGGQEATPGLVAPSDSANSETPETDLIVRLRQFADYLDDERFGAEVDDPAYVEEATRDVREAADALTRLREEIARCHALIVK